MIRLRPISTRKDTIIPYPTLVRYARRRGRVGGAIEQARDLLLEESALFLHHQNFRAAPAGPPHEGAIERPDKAQFHHAQADRPACVVIDRKSICLNSIHSCACRNPSSA